MGGSFRKWRWHAALAAAVLVLAADPVPAQSASSGAPIVLAAPLSLSGDGASFGRPTLEGMQLAVEEAEKANPGLRVKLQEQDDKGSDTEARMLAERIAAGPAVVVLGPAFSTASIKAGPVYAAAGLVSLPPTATSDAITENASTFRVIFKNSDQGELLAQYLVRVLEQRKASAVVVDSGYGATLRQGFEQSAMRLGIDVKYHSLSREPTDEALDALAKSLAAQPDRAIILLTLDPEGARLLLRLRRLGHAGPYLGGDAFGDAAFSRHFTAEAEERQRPGFFTDALFSLAPVILDSANAETLDFARRFRARFGHDPVWQTVAGYDAARIALAAIARAGAQAAPDPALLRRKVLESLKALDAPARALPGLLGPVWFDASRGRQQSIRVGRFRDGAFESAPLQIVPVAAPETALLKSGEVFELKPGRFGRLQRVVYTGIYLNEIQRVDVARSSFNADVYLWLRFAKAAGPGAADPTEIAFPSQIGGGFDRKLSSERRDRSDGTEYVLWRVQGEFRNDFDLRRFPFDRQTLRMPFFNARAANDKVVYVIDRRSTGPVPAGAAATEGAIASPDAFRNITQWDFTGAATRRENLVTQSYLGDLDRTAAEGTRELSGFVVAIDLQRRSLTTLAKSLLPLLVMSLITFASLFFPPALVKEKVTVAITGALSGAVLLAAINSQLGSIGYTVAVEYVFYVFFVLALVCIVSVLALERLRAAGHARRVRLVERGTVLLYGLTAVLTVAAILGFA